jgi:RHS repeat-associated protein
MLTLIIKRKLMTSSEVYVENLSSQAVWFDDLEIAADAQSTGALPVAIVVQETHYDPWGLELAGIGYVADPAKEHKFTYNGKEKQDQFGLGWLDYHARQVDPALGRMWAVDPLAHKMRRWSPYAYAFDNPVRFIDPDGMMPYPIGDYFKGLVNRAKQAAVNKVRELTINTLKAIVKTAKHALEKISVTPYAKVEGKATLGQRVALEAKKGSGFDFNNGSTTLLSSSIEVDNKGAKPETNFLGEGKNLKETKTGISGGEPVGTIGPVPIVVNGGSSIEQAHDKKTGHLVSTKVEGSANVSVAGTPLGIFLTGEHTARASGASTTVLRAAPFNFGVAVGAFVVLV